jgi:hypothetical protein
VRAGPACSARTRSAHTAARAKASTQAHAHDACPATHASLHRQHGTHHPSVRQRLRERFPRCVGGQHRLLIRIVGILVVVVASFAAVVVGCRACASPGSAGTSPSAAAADKRALVRVVAYISGPH